MSDLVILFCIAGCAAGIALAMIRVARGPTVLDRILAFDLIATFAVAIIALLSMTWQTAEYVELILIYTLLGFSGATAFTFYLQRAYDPHEKGRDDPRRARHGEES
jgi:multicomponent Na+:H+ antiporter subunit F